MVPVLNIGIIISFFLNENDEINLFRSNNIQTCVALLELKNIKNKTIKQLNYS